MISFLKSAQNAREVDTLYRGFTKPIRDKSGQLENVNYLGYAKHLGIDTRVVPKGHQILVVGRTVRDPLLHETNISEHVCFTVPQAKSTKQHELMTSLFGDRVALRSGTKFYDLKPSIGNENIAYIARANDGLWVSNLPTGKNGLPECIVPSPKRGLRVIEPLSERGNC